MKNKREIKFRAWDGKYMQKDEFYVDSDGDVLILNSTDYNEGRLVYVDWKLMQYTGICDKYDKEIYEGDIVRFNSFDDLKIKTGIVNFADGSFRITVDDYFHAYRWIDYDCEIIGNIYEKND
jgi:uncharacterized phage protein (TIGR01671 family)